MAFFYPEKENDTENARTVHLYLGNVEEEALESAKFISSQGDGNETLQYRACTAAQDYFMFDVYAGEPGLHLYKEARSGDLNMKLGYIAQWCDPKIAEELGFPLPKAGWAPLYQSVNRKYLGEFEDDKHEFEASQKHDFIDLYMMGGTVKLRVLSRQNWVAYWLAKFNGEVVAEKKESGKRVGEAIQVDLVSGRKANRRAKKAGKAQKETVEDFPMPVKGGASIMMSDLPLGEYWLCNANGRKQSQPEEWTGNNLNMFLSYKNFGYKLDKVPVEAMPS